jgi:hypothetical protein
MTQIEVNSLLESSVRKPEGQAALSSSALLAALVFRWRDAAAHHRKVASSRERSYGGQPLYEDGLAEAFDRCADILANEIAANIPDNTQ